MAKLTGALLQLLVANVRGVKTMDKVKKIKTCYFLET